MSATTPDADASQAQVSWESWLNRTFLCWYLVTRKGTPETCIWEFRMTVNGNESAAVAPFA